MDLDHAYRQAAESILAADALLIGAGAGMGVDSGLPDFRGPEGFWRAYPAFRGRRFEEMSNPVWFHRDPEQAWGFFGHRLNLYRATAPHAGFEILRRWGESRPLGCFVFTSNVDGHFQRAGFPEERLMECHGSIHHVQCVRGCTEEIWSAQDTTVAVDEATIRARPPLPQCIRCGGLARPNVLMFDDWQWVPKPTDDGTTFLVTEGAGSETGPAFITLNTNSTLKGVVLYYPKQKLDEVPSPYPYAIAMRGKNPAVLDVEMLNPYSGIDASRNERHLIRNVQGQPLRRGVFVDAIYDIGRIENVHFNPWWSNRPKLMAWQMANGEAFILARSDWRYMLNTFTNNSKGSVQIANNAVRPAGSGKRGSVRQPSPRRSTGAAVPGGSGTRVEPSQKTLQMPAEWAEPKYQPQSTPSDQFAVLVVGSRSSGTGVTGT